MAPSDPRSPWAEKLDGDAPALCTPPPGGGRGRPRSTAHRSRQRPARDQAGKPIPEFQKFQPGMPHAPRPQPWVFEANGPSQEGREPAGAGPQQREPDGGCVSTRGQGQKTVKGKNALARESLFLSLPRPARRGGLWLPRLQGREGGWPGTALIGGLGLPGATPTFQAAGTRPSPTPTRAPAAPPLRPGSRDTAPVQGRLETRSPRLSIPVLAPDLLLGHLAGARQRDGWKAEKASGRVRLGAPTLSAARSLAQRKQPN